MFTRQDYMNHECSYRKYYGQFVNTRLKEIVQGAMGLKVLLDSPDDNFNNISLDRWDKLPYIQLTNTMKNCGEDLTLSSKVCIYKEAALQIVESLKTVHE